MAQEQATTPVLEVYASLVNHNNGEEFLADATTGTVSALAAPNNTITLRCVPEMTGATFSDNHITWNFGDGTVKQGRVVTHSYDRPGKYQTYLGIVDGETGKTFTGADETPGILGPHFTVLNYLGDAVAWSYNKGDDYVPAGSTSAELILERENSWQSFSSVSATGYSIDLYAGGSRGRSNSIPLKTVTYDINKYAQFQKTWRFSADSTGLTPISSITTTDSNIYIKYDTALSAWTTCSVDDAGSAFIGTTGTASVYYTDDSSSLSAVGLLATLNTSTWPEIPGALRYEIDSSKYTDLTLSLFQTRTDRLGMKVYPATPNQLVFTSNGISNPRFYISKLKFENTSVPFFVSVADKNKNIIKDYPGHGSSIRLNGQFIYPWNPPTSFAPNTVYWGVSAKTWEDGANIKGITVADYESLSAVTTLGSYTGTFNISGIGSNLTLVGMMSSWAGVISGASTDFNILPCAGQGHALKFNEDFDAAETLKSYILQESINSARVFTDKFIHEAVGDKYDLPDTLGKAIYEKIANFTQNTVDIDTCSIRHLYSLAEEIGVELEHYNVSFPGGLQRLADLLSIKFCKLLGSRQEDDNDFDKLGVPDMEGIEVRLGRNRKDDGTDSSRLSTSTYIVTAGTPIIAMEKFESKYFKIVPLVIEDIDSTGLAVSGPTVFTPGLTSYPLSAYDSRFGWGLEYPGGEGGEFWNYYEFYEYVSNATYPLTSHTQAEGVLDWNNTYELLEPFRYTLTESTSSYSEWVKDDGIIDSILEWKLRDGLGLFEGACSLDKIADLEHLALGEPPEFDNPLDFISSSNVAILPPEIPNTSTDAAPVASQTQTPTKSQTPTPTHTPTQTPTNTQTPSQTPSSTSPATPTPTSTVGASPTQTPSYTQTPTRTPTQTPSNTTTQTATPSPTPSNTASQTPTQTQTPSTTPTQTATPPHTPSNTPTPTQTPCNLPDNCIIWSPGYYDTGEIVRYNGYLWESYNGGYPLGTGPRTDYNDQPGYAQTWRQLCQLPPLPSPTKTATPTATPLPSQTQTSTPTQTPTNDF
jgi:hypothetical protein